MTSLRLHEVLSIGVKNATGKRAHDGAPVAAITDESDPFFILAMKQALDNALVKLVDPPNPSAAWEEQLFRRANQFDSGMMMYSEDDPDSVPRPDPDVVAAYDETIKVNAARRKRLNARLAMVEANLMKAMSSTLQDTYTSMLE